MKIIYHHRIASKDGQYIHLNAICNELKSLGHVVRLVGPRTLTEGQFGSNGGGYSKIRSLIPAWAGEILELAYNFVAFLRLVRATIFFKPDFIYERYNLFSFAGVWVSRLLKCPLLMEINAPLADERLRHGNLVLRRIAERCERYVWRKSDALLPVTRVLANHVERVVGEDVNMVVIHNGCHRKLLFDDVVAKSNPFASINSTVILGFCGFLRDWHGLGRVIDLIASESFSQCCFLVVGDGPARLELEKHAISSGVKERVHITGVVSPEELQSYVKLFDIALQPDVVAYASPLKLFDYMALECAIVAPSKNNIREVLTHEEDALLFEPGSQVEFEGAISRLVECSALRKSLGIAARETVRRDRRTWTDNATRICEIAKDLRACAID